MAAIPLEPVATTAYLLIQEALGLPSPLPTRTLNFLPRRALAGVPWPMTRLSDELTKPHASLVEARTPDCSPGLTDPDLAS